MPLTDEQLDTLIAAEAIALPHEAMSATAISALAMEVKSLRAALHKLVGESAAYRSDRLDIIEKIRTSAVEMLEVAEKGADRFALEINAAAKAINPSRDSVGS